MERPRVRREDDGDSRGIVCERHEKLELVLEGRIANRNRGTVDELMQGLDLVVQNRNGHCTMDTVDTVSELTPDRLYRDEQNVLRPVSYTHLTLPTKRIV